MTATLLVVFLFFVFPVICEYYLKEKEKKEMEKEKEIRASAERAAQAVRQLRDHANELRHRGQKLLSEKKYEEALRYFDKISELLRLETETPIYSGDIILDSGYKEHDDPRVFSDRATCLDALGWKLDAIDDLNKAIKFYSFDWGRWFQRSEVKSACGDYSGAISDCEKAIRMLSEFIKRNNDSIDSSEKRIDFALTMDLYKTKAYEMSLTDAGLLRKRAEETKAKGRRKRNSAFENIVSNEYDIDTVLSKLDRKCEDMPSELRREHEYSNKNNRDVTKQKECNPNKTLERTDAKCKDVNSYLAHGKTYSSMGNHDAAMREINTAITLYPNDAKVYLSRGIERFSNNEYNNAMKDYSKAIELDPKCASAYFWRGMVYNNKKEYDSAILNFDKAIALDPELISAYENREKAHYGKGDNHSAQQDRNTAIDLRARKPSNASPPVQSVDG